MKLLESVLFHWLSVRHNRNGISGRLNHIKILLGEDKTVNLVEQVSQLSKAIIDHENSVSDSGRAPSPWDLVLWAKVKVLDV